VALKSAVGDGLTAGMPTGVSALFQGEFNDLNFVNNLSTEGWVLTGDGTPTLTVGNNTPAFGTLSTTAGAGNYSQAQFTGLGGAFFRSDVPTQGATIWSTRLRVFSVAGGSTNITNTCMHGLKFFIGFAVLDTDIINTTSAQRYLGFFKDDLAGDPTQAIRVLSGYSPSGDILDNLDEATGWTTLDPSGVSTGDDRKHTLLRRARKQWGNYDWLDLAIRTSPIAAADYDPTLLGLNMQAFVNGQEVMSKSIRQTSHLPNGSGMSPVVAYERDDAETMQFSFTGHKYYRHYGDD